MAYFIQAEEEEEEEEKSVVNLLYFVLAVMGSTTRTATDNTDVDKNAQVRSHSITKTQNIFL